jgi:hypothetical protein
MIEQLRFYFKPQITLIQLIFADLDKKKNL